MDRRFFLKSTSAASAVAAFPFPAKGASNGTNWVVRGSEGYDAVSFLGPLSGDDFYARYYPEEVAAFAPRLPAAALNGIRALKAELATKNRMLGPWLNLALSSGHDSTLDQVLSALADPEAALKPPYAASSYWSEESWKDLILALPQIRACLTALREAGFSAFWRERVSGPLSDRMAALSARLANYDLIPPLERYTGRTFDPKIEVVLLHFCKPHGIRVQGQQFLPAISWGDDIVIRTAGHELLHPPVDMNGVAAKAALAVLEQDQLFARIVAEHDPKFGYNSLDGMFNEDLAQSLDQIIGEHFKVAREPAERWTKADGGMHVLAAAFYGLMQQDGFARTGGNLEDWVYRKAKGGWLAPPSLHAAAARVLKRPTDRLWPLPAA